MLKVSNKTLLDATQTEETQLFKNKNMLFVF